jgi:hypothetical protein
VNFFCGPPFFRVALKRTAEKIAKNRERDWKKSKRQEQSRQRNSPRKETNGVREDVFQEKRTREKKRGVMATNQANAEESVRLCFSDLKQLQ